MEHFGQRRCLLLIKPSLRGRMTMAILSQVKVQAITARARPSRRTITIEVKSGNAATRRLSRFANDRRSFRAIRSTRTADSNRSRTAPATGRPPAGGSWPPPTSASDRPDYSPIASDLSTGGSIRACPLEARCNPDGAHHARADWVFELSIQNRVLKTSRTGSLTVPTTC